MKVKSWKYVLDSSYSEDGFCHLETMHKKKRTVLKPQLLVLVGRVQEQRPQPRKSVLGWSPSEDGFLRIKTMYSRMAPKPSCFCFSKIRGSCPSESSFCCSEMEVRGIAPRTNLLVPVRRLQKMSQAWKNFPEFKSHWRCFLYLETNYSQTFLQ
jgi:hypothetical protein